MLINLNYNLNYNLYHENSRTINTDNSAFYIDDPKILFRNVRNKKFIVNNFISYINRSSILFGSMENYYIANMNIITELVTEIEIDYKILKLYKNNINIEYKKVMHPLYSHKHLHSHRIKLILKNIDNAYNLLNNDILVNLNITYNDLKIRNLKLFIHNADIYNINLFYNNTTIRLSDNMLNQKNILKFEYNDIGGINFYEINNCFGFNICTYNDNCRNKIGRTAIIKYNRCFTNKILCNNRFYVKLYKFNHLFKLFTNYINRKKTISLIYMFVYYGIPYELICIYLKYVNLNFII